MYLKHEYCNEDRDRRRNDLPRISLHVFVMMVYQVEHSHHKSKTPHQHDRDNITDVANRILFAGFGGIDILYHIEGRKQKEKSRTLLPHGRAVRNDPMPKRLGDIVLNRGIIYRNRLSGSQLPALAKILKSSYDWGTILFARAVHTLRTDRPNTVQHFVSKLRDGHLNCRVM